MPAKARGKSSHYRQSEKRPIYRLPGCLENTAAKRGQGWCCGRDVPARQLTNVSSSEILVERFKKKLALTTYRVQVIMLMSKEDTQPATKADIDSLALNLPKAVKTIVQEEFHGV